MDLNSDYKKLTAFAGNDFKGRVAKLEAALFGCDLSACRNLGQAEFVDSVLLDAILKVKRAASQIDSIVHTVGMIMLLPKIVDPEGEFIEEISLSAGTGSKRFDLTTNRRIAEFKFVNWQGSGDSIRRQSVLRDFAKLVEFPSFLKKQLFLIDPPVFEKWIRGRSSIEKNLKKDPELLSRLKKRCGDSILTVGDYYRLHMHGDGSKVEFVDVLKFQPSFRRLPSDEESEASEELNS